MARPRRIPGYSYTGIQRYFLTICTYNRIAHFRDDASVRIVLDQFLHTASEQGIALVVYVAMPDHMHLLVDGQSECANLTAFVRLAKQRSGYWFKQNHGVRLWQKGYYEHVLRDAEKSEEVAYYIIANPLRKGLVERALDYPYWGSSLCSREELIDGLMIRG